MTYCFDLDGTLCYTEGTQYENSTPIRPRIDAVNRLRDLGHTIIVFTGRGSVDEGVREMTENQLKSWGIRCNRIIFGKPVADLYVDDRGVHTADFFRTLNATGDPPYSD